MLLTKSNVLLGRTPTVVAGASTDDPENIVNPDFSSNYTGINKNVLTIDFGATAEINYVSLAGILLAGNGSGSSVITIQNGNAFVASATVSRNNCYLVSFESQTFSNLRVKLTNGTNDLEPTISFAAAGVAFTVPNGGETVGYGRHWLNRPIKTKTTTNNLAAPVAILRKPVALKGALNLPNMTAAFSQGEYQDFLDFAVVDLFFINEDPLLPESTYCCFEITPTPPKAHAQTRSLNNLSFSFKVFSGL